MTIALADNGSPILNQFSKGDLVDTIFKISEFEELDHSYKMLIGASFDGTDVGLGIEVAKDIKAGFDADMAVIENHAYPKALTFNHIGKQSDALLAVLAGLYGFKGEKIYMVKQTSFTAIALHQGEIELQNQPIKLKIFGKDGKKDREEHYNESYFIIDIQAGWVCWNEKDPQYREALILGLLE